LQGYLTKFQFLHDNLQRQSHRNYGPATSVTWL